MNVQSLNLCRAFDSAAQFASIAHETTGLQYRFVIAEVPLQLCSNMVFLSLFLFLSHIHTHTHTQEYVEQPAVSMESVYLENAVCAFTRKNYEEAALGMGISFNKDLR